MVTPTLHPVWLDDADVQRLFAVLGAPTVDVRSVGGCVRDAVLGRDRPDAEIDIGTPEPPRDVMQRLSRAGIRAVATGLAHGTVTAVIDGHTFEITSLRRDTACDGRHAQVEFTTDWQEDARRRDFTMNAMSLTPKGLLHDYHGGAADARDGRVRFVGAPDDRIQEDYLRILRLFRFTALYGRTPIDELTLAACRRHKTGLRQLSAERVHGELAKLLAAPNPAPTVDQMAACGVLGVVVSESATRANLEHLVAAERAVGSESMTWVRRLAALVPETDIAAMATKLKLSRAETERLQRIVMPLSPPAADVRRAVFRDGPEIAVDRLLLTWALDAAGGQSPAPIWRDAVALARQWTPPPVPVRGDDAIALGVAPGPRMGELLDRVTAWWIGRDFQPSRAEAQAELARLIRIERG
jgi:poly(A) polymerase